MTAILSAARKKYIKFYGNTAGITEFCPFTTPEIRTIIGTILRKRRHYIKFIKQFGIILVISLIGELLNFLIPLPIPASIYGLVLMLLCLQLHIIPISEVKETSAFLIEIMPLMFIPAAVGLITSFDILKAHLAAYLVITVTSTFLVMVVSGHVTQFVIRHRKAGSFK